MKIENIKFIQQASKRVYSDYMNRVTKATSSLSKESKEDIYMEINSHIFEAIQLKTEGNEIDRLLDILEKLGNPEEVLKPLVADKKLEQATKTFNPVHIFKALALNFANGISYIIFIILYLSLFSFVFLIFAKIFNPAEVGLFYKNNTSWILGLSNSSNQMGSTELLGNWFILSMVVLTIVLYFVITLLLKLKKSIHKKLII